VDEEVDEAEGKRDAIAEQAVFLDQGIEHVEAIFAEEGEIDVRCHTTSPCSVGHRESGVGQSLCSCKIPQRPTFG
jgi:hypothetical protein